MRITVRLLLSLLPATVSPAREAGIFYSTLYAKTVEVEWASGFGGDASAWYLTDVDGDGRDDAVVFYAEGPRRGRAFAALSDGSRFGEPAPLEDFKPPPDRGLDIDVDGDGRVDRVTRDGATWRVAYADGSGAFAAPVDWVVGLGPREGGRRTHAKQNPPPSLAFLTGSLDGEVGWACMVDAFGRWFAVKNPVRGRAFNLVAENTWAGWRCSYLPQLPGLEGTYDSGDPAVHDVQLAMLHDAGFTYVTLDITNGDTEFVDSRAKALIDSIRRWNRNRAPGQRELRFNVSLGRTRRVRPAEAYFEKLNEECRRAWEEFYQPNRDVYHLLHGKPLVIHMITTGYDYNHALDDWSGPRDSIDRCTLRWMSGDQPGAHTGRPNTYGWIVPGMYGNAVHDEMMPVMPGFWNAITYYDREGGDLYRTQWLRVLEHQPASVWVNSLNETWEHTSVEPAYMFNHREPHRGITAWTDLHGERMDDFYWVMTRQYMKLYMENRLYDGTHLQEFVTEHRFGPVFEATVDGFKSRAGPPRGAPVLLVPRGFIAGFDGGVVDDPGWRAALDPK